MFIVQSHILIIKYENFRYTIIYIYLKNTNLKFNCFILFNLIKGIIFKNYLNLIIYFKLKSSRLFQICI